MKNSVGCRVSVSATQLAAISLALLQLVVGRDLFIELAEDAIGIKIVFKPLQTGIVIWEVLTEVFNGVAHLFSHTSSVHP